MQQLNTYNSALLLLNLYHVLCIIKLGSKFLKCLLSFVLHITYVLCLLLHGNGEYNISPYLSQIRETASRKAHNLEVVGSTPASATKEVRDM